MMSLLHKEIGVDAGNYVSMMRPWFCGVGDPRTGKSHAEDPFINIVQEMCSEWASYCIGSAEDGFHLVRSRTYAAFEDKLRDTQGYMSGEGSQYLCP